MQQQPERYELLGNAVEPNDTGGQAAKPIFAIKLPEKCERRCETCEGPCPVWTGSFFKDRVRNNPDLTNFTALVGCASHSSTPDHSVIKSGEISRICKLCNHEFDCKEHDEAIRREEIKRILNWIGQLEYYISSPDSLEDYQTAWNALKNKIKSTYSVELCTLSKGENSLR